MKRLTERTKLGSLIQSDISSTRDMIDKLGAYEDMEELCIKECGCGLRELIDKYQERSEGIYELMEYTYLEREGLLLRLPCKVGDTVYRLIPKTYRHIEPLKVRKFVICENGLCFVTEKTSFHYSCDEFEEFIFLTREEAEQALAEMKGV